MHNNHFWTLNSSASFDMKSENNDFLSQNPYQLLSSSSNLFFPFFYSHLPFQNFIPQSVQSFIHPNLHSSHNEVSFQSLPELKEIKIENKEDCCQQKICQQPFNNNPSPIKQGKKELLNNPPSKTSSKTNKKINEDSKNNNLNKKQNQICDVEFPKTYPHIVSQLKTTNSQTPDLSIIKQLTKELILLILNCQKPEIEMLMPIKNQIVNLFKQLNKKQKKPIDQFVDDIIKILSLKFTKFKKTKEEMIKYIFRKIFNLRNKPEQIDQSSWKMAQKVHRKNFNSFKSMNMKYVEKQFENPIFIELFSIFLNKFHINFQKENQERVDRLNKIVASCIFYEDLTELKSYKKMPWNKNVVQNIQVLFKELNQIQINAQKTQNIHILNQELQKEQHLAPSQNQKEKGCFLWRQKTN